MNELLQYLDQFEPVQHHAQYALNGNWEEAVVIDVDDSSASLGGASADATIAVEVFFELNDQRMIFLGVRYSDGLAAAQSPAQFLNKVLSSLGQAKHQGPRELLETLGAALNNNPHTYIGQPVQYGELGVEGYWKSEGSVVLRQAGDPALDVIALEEKLQQHPQLLKNSKNATAIEFAVTAPTGWIGVQVSTPKDGLFVTDQQSLLVLANKI